MPDEYVKYGEGFLRLNPGWEMMTWTDKHVPLMRNRDLFDRATNYTERSDLARYEALYEFGGVFIDTDVECLHSFEDLRYQDHGRQGFCGDQEPGRACTAVIGAECGSDLIDRVIGKFPLAFAQNPHDMIARLFVPFSADYALRHVFRCYPPSFFYPYHYTEKHRKGEAFPGSFAVHHWAGGWAA